MDKILWDLKGSCFFTSWWCHEIVSVLFVLSNSWLACLQTKALAVAELLCWFDRVRRSLRKKAHVSMSSGGDWLPCSLLTALCRQSVVSSSGFCDRVWKEWKRDLLKRPLHMWAVSKSSDILPGACSTCSHLECVCVDNHAAHEFYMMRQNKRF